MSMLKDLGWHVAGEVWGDASAALGTIHRRGLGKTRHIDIGLLWIQQTAAERELKFGKANGKHNPADFYTKHMDVETIGRHTTTLACEFTEGRAKEAPKLHVIQCDDQDLCQDVREFCVAVSTNKSLTRRQRAEMVGSKCLCMVERLTGSGQQVLHGNNWQIQGSNGSNAAQLSQPWGATLTFQLYAGVSWVHGLRHWVARHPRGRHLREGMTLLLTWENQHRSVNSCQHISNHNYHNHTTTKKFGKEEGIKTVLRNDAGYAEGERGKRRHNELNIGGQSK